MSVEAGGPNQTADDSSENELIEKNIGLINFIIELGEGKECDKAFEDEVISPLKRPYITNAKDIDLVQRTNEKHLLDDTSEELENRRKLSSAFEKSLIILGNFPGLDFFGKNSEFAISSKFDDIVNGVDIIGRIRSEDGQSLFCGIDATTSRRSERLTKKYYKNRERLGPLLKDGYSQEAAESIRSGVRYWPQSFLYEKGVKRERSYQTDKPELTINVMAGLSSGSAIDCIHLAVKALAIYQKERMGRLEENEKEKFINNVKTSPIRIELITQLLQQTEKSLMSFDIGNEEKKERIKLLREQLIDAEELAKEEGSYRNQSLSREAVSTFIERNYSVPDSVYYEDTSKSSDE